MTTSDVRDVLNLGGTGGPRPSKKAKLSASKPNLRGLAREVQNLGGDNPIAIVPQVTSFKKRRLASRKPAARWELQSFRNSARDDQSLILRHWKRKDTKYDQSEGIPPAESENAAEAMEQDTETQPKEEPRSSEGREDSAFAKFNVQVTVPEYSDDQYQESLQSSGWTKDETDYLIQLARDFDLRWPLIWDRYDWSPVATNGEADADGDESKAVVPMSQNRSMEDLKVRYYDVAAKMMALAKPVQYMTQAEYSLHQTMTQFSPQREKARKDFALNALSRSPEEAREEESLLLEIKRIMARSEGFNQERSELYSRLDYPHTETDISPFRTSNGLSQLFAQLMNVDKSKKRKSIMGAEGIDPASATSATPTGPPDSARRDSTAGPAGHRDSLGGSASTPITGNKKGQAQQLPERRKLTDQEEVIYGVTHHDRLGSGPTFRTEKINKLFSHKSNQQQQRINNTLTELDVPAKLAMPTSATTHQFELLLGAVNSLLDARKITDKVDGEIKIELAKKAERERALKPDGHAGARESAQNGEQTGADSDPSGKGLSQPSDDPEVEQEDKGEEVGPEAVAAEKGAEGLQPESSGGMHKRSASVLSSVSDKSTKRQKK